MSLITLATLKTHLNVTTSAEDARLTQFIAQAETIVKRFVQRELVQATYVEYLSGRNTNVLLLRETPVTSITEVRYDPQGRYGQNPNGFLTSTILTAGEDYILRPDRPDGKAYAGMLERVRSVWTGSLTRPSGSLSYALGEGHGNVKVTYSGGYVTIPDDIQWAICQMVSLMRQTAATGSILESESFQDRSISLAVPPHLLLSPEIKFALQPYRKLRA